MKNLVCSLFLSLFSLSFYANVSSPLGFQLMDFSAECSEESVKLNWTTAEEINVEFFIIERSKDALTFDSIGITSQKINLDNGENRYEYIDSPSNSGIYYYRIKHYDKSKGCKMSKIVWVQYEKKGAAFNLYPNPSNGIFTLNYSVLESDQASFIIHSLRGKMVGVYQLDPLQSSLLLTLNLEKGVYYGDLRAANKPLKRFKIIID